ncbi:polyprenyl synthetase family protein [Verrucomicrobiota bacterium]
MTAAPDGPGTRYTRRADTELRKILDEVKASSDLPPWREFLWPAVQSFAAGGKRLRPALMVMACGGYAGEVPRGVWRCAAAAELFHTFALIHDDIIDGSARRRGRPSMSVRLQTLMPEETERRRRSEELAVLVGDVLHALAVRTFVSAGLPVERLSRALDLLSGAAVATGMGAAAEFVLRNDGMIPAEAALLELYDRKTGIYSFTCPLQVGAVLGDAPPGDLPVLARVGCELGRAFQIQDDLDDLETYLEGEVPSLQPREMRLMLPVACAAARADAEQREWLEHTTRSSSLTGEVRAQIKRILGATGATDETRRAMRSCLRRGEEAAADLCMAACMRSEILAFCRGVIDPDGAGKRR